MAMRKEILTSCAAALLLAAASAAHAQWQDRISPADLDRLNHLADIRDAAWADARRSDGGAVDGVMGAQGRTVPAEALTGEWRCRQMKLGGMTTVIVYDWFPCTIRPAAGGLLLEKTGGSQPFAGYLFPENGAWIYVGASRVRGEPVRAYSGASPALGGQVTHDDQVGLLTGIGDDHLRLEIPAVQESLLDVVEFAR
jgi:hypothetical protein